MESISKASQVEVWDVSFPETCNYSLQQMVVVLSVVDILVGTDVLLRLVKVGEEIYRVIWVVFELLQPKPLNVDGQ